MIQILVNFHGWYHLITWKRENKLSWLMACGMSWYKHNINIFLCMKFDIPPSSYWKYIFKRSFPHFWFDSKIIHFYPFLEELFLSKVGKMSLFMPSWMKKTYFFIICTKFHFVTIYEFFVCYLTNSSWHSGPYGSLWTGMSPTKYYMDRSKAEVHILFCGWQTGP